MWMIRPFTVLPFPWTANTHRDRRSRQQALGCIKDHIRSPPRTMSDPGVTAYLTKLLCSHGGRLQRNQLSDLLDLPERQIEQILRDDPLRFPQSSLLVLARSFLRICTRYLHPDGERNEEECPKLHLCRHYLRGQCPPNRRPRCRFSHDVDSYHNRAVLKVNELSGLNEDEIKVLLFQNDHQLLPEDCRQYRHNNCDQGEACTRLHVCNFFTQGICNRLFCTKSHNLLESNLLLTCNWLSQDTIENFQMLCVLKHSERKQALREGNAEPRGERGMSRGRGRGRRRVRRRAESQDLLDSGRERRNEELRFHWRSSSRPSSPCSMGQCSGDEDYDIDSSSGYGRYPRTNLDKLMDDWFTENKEQSGKAHVKSSVGVTRQQETRSVPPTKCSEMSSKLLKRQTHIHKMEYSNSRLTSEITRASHNTSNMAYSSSNACSTTPVHEFYKPYIQEFNPSVPRLRPKVPPRIEQSVYYPTPLTASSSPAVVAMKSGPSITLPKHSAISSTSYSLAREYPSIQPKPTDVSIEIMNPPTAGPSRVLSPPSSSLNRPVDLSAGSSSSAKTTVSPSLTVSYISEISSTKGLSTPNKELDMELDNALDSSMKRLSIAPSTPSKTSLYSNRENSSVSKTTLTTPTVSGHVEASSRSGSSNVSVGDYTSKPQASVKPITKTETSSGAQYSLSDEDFDFFCQPPKATNSAATQPQQATNIPSVSPRKSWQGKTPEICLRNIWNYCDLKDKCADMHYCLPYRWQVFNVIDWDDLPNMEDIEKAYSDPNIDRHQMIDFQTMKSSSKPVRRLTTPSSVTKPPEYVLTTEWCWYWKNEFGSWTEYGQLNTENISSNILSSDLETIYLSDPTEMITFTVGAQNYIIDFQGMKQKNIYFKTEKEVCRRPKFLDFQKVKMLRGSKKPTTDSIKQKQSDSHLKNGIYPPLWKMESMPDIGYMKVLLPQNSTEFTNIVAMFSKTLYDHTVKKIWRVQNPALWELYDWQKDQMKKRNLGSTVNERQLFHGTNRANIDAICSQNFDWRICGTNGTAYGKGSYFARDASYSHSYTPPTSTGARTMFVARVLVGDFIEGNPQLRLPPQKCRDQSYDSCVDNVYTPSIFVVFQKQQIYPEYILEYE